MTLAFSGLELFIDTFCWQATGTSQRIGQILTSPLSITQKNSVLAALFRERVADEALRAEMDLLRKDITKAIEDRNALTHGGWAASAEAGAAGRFRYRVDAKAGLTFQMTDVSAADIDAMSDRLVALKHRLALLFLRVFQPREASVGEDGVLNLPE
jgi:hypothetical protein